MLAFVLVCNELMAQKHNKLCLENKTTDLLKMYPIKKKVAFVLKDGRKTEMTRVVRINKENIICDDTIYTLNQVQMVIVYYPRTKLETSFSLIPAALLTSSPFLYGHMDEGIIPFFIVSAISLPFTVTKIVRLCLKPPRYNLAEWDISTIKR